MHAVDRLIVVNPLSWFGLLILLLFPTCSQAGSTKSNSKPVTTFHWIQSASSPQLWRQIESAFHDELAPDESKDRQDELDVYRDSYLQKVGVLDHSALVVIGHRPSKKIFEKNPWDEYSSAFNFDLPTGQKSKIEHADVMWQWRFLKLARFGPSAVPDVTFTYLTCTECEPETLLASLRYNTMSSAWEERRWGDGKPVWWTAKDGLVIDMDVNNGGDTSSFDCAYRIFDLNGDGFQDAVIRCKEVIETGETKPKIADSTVICSLSAGRFKCERIKDESEIASLMAKVCQPSSASALCRLPRAK
jgi:hypothetical protein